MLTPYEVLKTSGHVDKFADWMSKDPKNGEIFRADHLVEAVLEARLKGDKEARGQKVEEDDEKKEEDAKKKKKKVKNQAAVKLDDALVKEYEEVLAKIDNYNGEELGMLMKKYDIRNPTTGGELLPPVAFNLMFQTAIGPSSNQPGFLRPETAQGQFLFFQDLLDFNQQQMPFASASIGKSFRNEISPRSGLLRVREFLMAEIEHFVDPEGGKKHPRFEQVKDVELELLNREVQLAGKTHVETTKIGDAVASGLVDNETLGYFLARIQLFLLRIGVDPKKIRFRQHMANEMAHYAADCWDAELLTSYGWIECVGCADRSAYDLTVHMKKTGAPLVVREPRKEPLHIEEWAVDINKKKFGPIFKKDGKTVEAAIEALTQDMREKLSLDLEKEGKIVVDVPGVGDGKVEVPKELVTIEKRTRVENVREYTPNVIEPSFGIGRIVYALCEHSYWARAEDEARGVLSFPPEVAPTKVLIVPLSTHSDFKPFIETLTDRLDDIGISSRVDDSGASIGKRYSVSLPCASIWLCIWPYGSVAYTQMSQTKRLVLVLLSRPLRLSSFSWYHRTAPVQDTSLDSTEAANSSHMLQCRAHLSTPKHLHNSVTNNHHSVMTSSAPPSASPSTFSPSRTTPSPCVTATPPSRCALAWTTSARPSRTSSRVPRSGRM